MCTLSSSPTLPTRLPLTRLLNHSRAQHIFQPYSPDEAAAARAKSEAAGRLNGDLLGACLLLPDHTGAAVATIDQLAVCHV